MVDNNTENTDNKKKNGVNTGEGEGKEIIKKKIGREFEVFKQSDDFKSITTFQNASTVFHAFIAWLEKDSKRKEFLDNIKKVLNIQNLTRDHISELEISYGMTLKYAINTEIEKKLTKPFKKAVCSKFLEKFKNTISKKNFFPKEIYEFWQRFQKEESEKFTNLDSITTIGSIFSDFISYLQINGINLTSEQVKLISSIKISNGDILNQLLSDKIIEEPSFDAIKTISDISMRENIPGKIQDEILNNFENILFTEAVSYLGEDLNNCEQIAYDLSNSYSIPKLNSIWRKYRFSDKALEKTGSKNEFEIRKLNPDGHVGKDKILSLFIAIREVNPDLGKALISLYKNNFDIGSLSIAEKNAIIKEIKKDYQKNYLENIASLIGVDSTEKVKNFNSIIDDLFDLSKDSVEIPYKHGNETKTLQLKIRKDIKGSSHDIENISSLFGKELFLFDFEVEVPDGLEEHFKYLLRNTKLQYINFAGHNIAPSYKMSVIDNNTKQVKTGYYSRYYDEHGIRKKGLFSSPFPDASIEDPLMELKEEEFLNGKYSLQINDQDKKLSIQDDTISNIVFMFSSIIGCDEDFECTMGDNLRDTFSALDNISQEIEEKKSDPGRYLLKSLQTAKDHEIYGNIDILEGANEAEKRLVQEANAAEENLEKLNNSISEVENLRGIFENMEKLDEINFQRLSRTLNDLDNNTNNLLNNVNVLETLITTSLDFFRYKKTFDWIKDAKDFLGELKDKIGSSLTGFQYYKSIWINDDNTNKEFLEFIKQNIFSINTIEEVSDEDIENNFTKVRELFDEVKKLGIEANRVLQNGSNEVKENIELNGEDENIKRIQNQITGIKNYLNKNISKRFEGIFENKDMKDKNNQINEISEVINSLNGLSQQVDVLFQSVEELNLNEDLSNLILELEELSKLIDNLRNKAETLLHELKTPPKNKAPKAIPEKNQENIELKELLKEWDGIDGDADLAFPNEKKNKDSTILYVYFENSKLPGGGNHLAKMEILGTKNPYKFRITSAEYPNKGEFTREIVLNSQNLRFIKSQFDKICKFKRLNNLKDFYDYINNFSIKTDNNKALSNIKVWQKDKGIEFEEATLKKKNDKGKLEKIKYIGKTLTKYHEEKKKNVGCFYKVEFGTNTVKLTYEGGGYSQEMDYNSFMMFVAEKGLSAYTKDEYKNTVQNLELERAEAQGPRVWFSIGTIIKSLKKFPEQIKWKLEQRNNFKTAKLYSMLAQALPPMGILGQIKNEAITEYDSSIWSVIQKYKERIARADVGGGGIHAKQAAKIIDKDIFSGGIFKGSEFKYKAVGYLLYAIEKGGGPYFRDLRSHAGKGLRVKAILGDDHHRKYMLKMRDMEKRVKENPDDEDALDQLIKSEVFYIKDEMPTNIFGTQAGSALEGAYINMFADSKVDDIKKSEEAKSDFQDIYGGFGAYFEQLRAPNMLAALQAMVSKITGEGLYKEFYRCMLIPVISGVSKFNWVTNNRDQFKAIGRTYALPITTFVDDANGAEKIVKIIDYISKKAGLSGDMIFSKAIGWKKENMTMENYSPGHIKMHKKLEGWWASYGDMVIRSLNYGEDYILKAQEDEKCDHQTKAVIKEYIDTKVNKENVEEWTSSTKGFISAEVMPFYRNGIFNLGAGPIENFMLTYNDGNFKHKFAQGMWETLQNKLINMNSKGANKYEVKFMLQKHYTWFKKQYYEDIKYMVSALSKIKNEGEDAYKYLTPFMKRQISRKKKDNDVPEIIDNTLGEFQKFFIKNIDLIDKDMVKDVFGEQIAESFRPQIVENFNPGGYAGSKLKSIRDNKKFIEHFENDFSFRDANNYDEYLEAA